MRVRAARICSRETDSMGFVSNGFTVSSLRAHSLLSHKSPHCGWRGSALCAAEILRRRFPMKKLLTTVAALLLFTFVSAQGAHAQSPFTTAGTWTFFVKINGAPPCQCIQLGNLKPDGTIEVPANDNFTGNGFGLWKQIGNGDVKV